MKECPNCATDIPDDAVVCRICRYEFARRPALPWKPAAWVLLLVLLVPAVIALVRAIRGPG